MELSRWKKNPETTYVVIKSNLVFILYMIPRNLKQGGISYPCPASDMALGPVIGEESRLLGGT